MSRRRRKLSNEMEYSNFKFPVQFLKFMAANLSLLPVIHTVFSDIAKAKGTSEKVMTDKEQDKKHYFSG